MPNPVHLILTLEDEPALALALSRGRRLYAKFVCRASAPGPASCLKGRFGSVAMEEDHLVTAARAVALKSGAPGRREARRETARKKRIAGMSP